VAVAVATAAAGEISSASTSLHSSAGLMGVVTRYQTL